MSKRVWFWVALFLVIVAATVLLGGCSRAPDHGYVHEKDYSPAYSYPTSYCMVYQNTKYGMSCMIYGTRTVTIPASWTVDIYASKDDHGWVDVDPATFQRLKVGDYYTVKDE